MPRPGHFHFFPAYPRAKRSDHYVCPLGFRFFLWTESVGCLTENFGCFRGFLGLTLAILLVETHLTQYLAPFTEYFTYLTYSINWSDARSLNRCWKMLLRTLYFQILYTGCLGSTMLSISRYRHWYFQIDLGSLGKWMCFMHKLSLSFLEPMHFIRFLNKDWVNLAFLLDYSLF